MNPAVATAATMYATNRDAFIKEYGADSLVEGLLDEIFLESESRPDLAERVALVVIGHKPSAEKRGYDGISTAGRLIEAKVRNAVSNEYGHFPDGLTATTINDVSQAIIDRYDTDNPVFVFPYFLDGHLAAVFSVQYKDIRHKYVECLAKHKKGRVSFKMGAGVWIKKSEVSFMHRDPEVVAKLPKILAERATGIKRSVDHINEAIKKNWEVADQFRKFAESYSNLHRVRSKFLKDEVVYGT